MQCHHQEVVLTVNADAAEFCNLEGNENLLAVGTYELNESTKERHGCLFLYSLAASTMSSNTRAAQQPRLQQETTLQLPGIFDLQWIQLPHIPQRPCIGLALADGRLQLLSVESSTSNCSQQQLQQLCSCPAVNQGMALSLDWNSQLQHSTPQAAVSSSSGSVSVLQAAPASLIPLLEWQAHELEAWMATWHKHQAHVLFSGADDSTFKGWDIRCPAAITCVTQDRAAAAASEGLTPPEANALFNNRRAHAAGVCCISCHPRKEHVLVTGSYDEAARLWDMRKLQQPIETCKVGLGGGVWRLKWHPRHDHLLLAACMYNGFALVTVDEAWDGLQVVEEYQGHSSIAYGADWFKGSWPQHTHAADNQAADVADTTQATVGNQSAEIKNTEALPAIEQLALHPSSTEQHTELHTAQAHMPPAYSDIIATCSFYDRRLHLWSPKYSCRYG